MIDNPMLRMRATGCLHALTLAYTFARENGHSAMDLASYSLDCFEEGGYYDVEDKTEASFETIKAYAAEFMRGRRMIYDNISLSETAGQLTVKSELWHWKNPPEFFFYYDLTPEEFSSYTSLLATENARRKGIPFHIEYDGGFEIAQIGGTPE